MRCDTDSGDQGAAGLQELVAALCQELGADLTLKAMARCLIETAARVLPGRRIAVRICSPLTGDLLATATTGEETLPDRLEVRPADGAGAPYRRIFAAAGEGFSAALCSGGAVLGRVNVEHERPYRDRLRDQQLVAPLADILALAVGSRRSARSVDRVVRRQLNRIIDHAPALIFVLGADGRVTLFNRELVARTGHAAQQVVGREVAEFLPPQLRDHFSAAFARALAGGPVVGHELTLLTAAGEAVRTIFTMARLVDPTDAGGTVVAIGQDVTAIKLLESQVLQSAKLASLGQLAAGVVHEINNPLTSITVYADFLIKKFREAGCDPADILSLVRIMEGSNRILKFTRDLVDFAKPSVDRFDAISLNEIVTQSISFCEHILEQAGAALVVELSPDLVPLYGVKDQLQQVIINLVTNACHALAGAGGELRIRTSGTASAVTVEIADAGGGIPGEALHRIFEPFFTTKAPGEGTGLGLSIVKKIIDFHDGSIMVRSDPGLGTSFCVTLPTRHRQQGPSPR